MEQMRERLRVESLNPRFDWSLAEVAKDLAAHYWFLREWWVQPCQVESLNNLLGNY